jgi:hypothetical protein
MCGIACLLLIVLWVRSYWRWDTAWRYTTAGEEWRIDSQNGEAFLRHFQIPREELSTLQTGMASRPALKVEIMPPKSHAGFCLIRGRNDFGLFTPYWFLALVVFVSAALPWVRILRLRFTIRTLLIATTLLAAILGAIVYAAN